MKLLKHKIIGISLLLSFLVVIGVKAASPYQVSIYNLNDTEFPRVQMALSVTGDTVGLIAKHFEILEAGAMNDGPRVLLPPATTPHNLDFRILLDTSAESQQDLIKANLKGLVNYLFDSELDASLTITSFDGAQNLVITDLHGADSAIESLSFSAEQTGKIDGFIKISQEASSVTRSGAQKIMLILNASDFVDERIDGVSGQKMMQAVSAVTSNNYLTFVQGHPLRKIHAVRADDLSAELVDFSHMVPGGYLGGFGADLSSLVDLLGMQSDKHFVMQYYSNYSTTTFAGNQAVLRIGGYDSHTFSYSSSPSAQLTIGHIPENELVLGEDIHVNVDLGHDSKMVNALEVTYLNKDDVFETITLPHQRILSTSESLRYSGVIPADKMGDENFAYTISVHTPYSSVGSGGGMITVPVNAYDDGITLTPTLVNGTEVLWRWEGPTVSDGKEFEVWMGDTLLDTVSETNYTIPLDDCNRYQIVQVRVIFPSGEKSYPSRPYEYYADAGTDGPISEKEAVTLMVQCIAEKELDSYTKLVANVDGFSSAKNITMERAGLYLARIIAEDIWQKIESQNGYYQLLYYIMIFIDRDEYLTYGQADIDIPSSLIHKLIAKANNTADINASFDKALTELVNRLRSNLSI